MARACRAPRFRLFVGLAPGERPHRRSDILDSGTQRFGNEARAATFRARQQAVRRHRMIRQRRCAQAPWPDACEGEGHPLLTQFPDQVMQGPCEPDSVFLVPVCCIGRT